MIYNEITRSIAQLEQPFERGGKFCLKSKIWQFIKQKGSSHCEQTHRLDKHVGNFLSGQDVNCSRLLLSSNVCELASGSAVVLIEKLTIVGETFPLPSFLALSKCVKAK